MHFLLPLLSPIPSLSSSHYLSSHSLPSSPYLFPPSLIPPSPFSSSPHLSISFPRQPLIFLFLLPPPLIFPCLFFTLPSLPPPSLRLFFLLSLTPSLPSLPTFLSLLISFLLYFRFSSPPLTMLPPILRPLVRMLLTSIRGLRGSHLTSLSCRARLRRSSSKLIV